MDSYGTRQMIAGEAKDLAVLYQKAAGGTGDLNLLKIIIRSARKACGKSAAGYEAGTKS